MTLTPLDYRALFERSQAGAFRRTLDGRLLDCNDAFAKLFGYGSREEILAAGMIRYFNPSDSETILAALRDLKSLTNLEVCFLKRDNSLLWALENVTLMEADGKPCLEGILLEITEQRQAAERMEHQIYHDPLTGLPNRTLLTDRLNVALAQAKRNEKPLSVLFVDLDHFELINSTLGYGLGDRMLKGIADRLNEVAGAESTVSRFGSDEFTLVLPSAVDAESAALSAEKVMNTVSAPFVLDGHEVFVNASVGIALSPEDGEDAESLLKNAGTAMYRAKEMGRNSYQLYSKTMNARAFERLSLVTSLRNALERGEFVLHYQPEVNVITGKISCIEALIRWEHPELGLVEPKEFMAAAEDANLTIPIGEWVLRESCRQLVEWHKQGLKDLRIAVNLSTAQFLQTELVRSVQKSLFEFNVAPEHLELEITEDSMQDTNRSIPLLHSLRNLGVHLTIDDFGTGRSSFTELKKTPVDSVKIDRSFVNGITRRNDDAAIVSAVIGMARGLNLRVVAEGVETMDQLAFLRDRRCSEMQGYFFSRPRPAASLEPTLRLQH